MNNYAELYLKLVSSQKNFLAILAPREEKIYDFIGEGELSREVERNFNLSPIQMKCIVKRSMKLEYKGMKIERFGES